MKARVISTGEIVEVKVHDKYFDCNGHQWIIYEDRKGRTFNEKHLEFNLDNSPLDYWEKLKHQYAGMAMQGLLSNERCWEESADKIAEVAICYAKELIKGLKLERSN